jgi:quinol monooxygenase YgiN
MPVRVLVGRHLRPGTADEYFGLRAADTPSTRDEPGCVQYEIFQSTDDPNHVVTVELWEDEAAFSAHRAVLQAKPPGGGHLADPEVQPPWEGIEIYSKQLLFRPGPDGELRPAE